MECKSHYEQLEPHSLEHLIFVDWVLGEASHLGLKASASEIQQQMQTTKQSFEKQPGGYQKFLEESGTTAADLLRQVTFSQLEGKLSQKISQEVTAKANSQGVPHSKIAAYYKENLSKYEHPETRDIQVIITESLGAALKAKQEIQSGKSFASVEKRVSRYPAEAGQIKADGGMLPEVMRRKFETVKHSMPGASTPSDEKILEEAIFSAKEHVLTGPVKTSEAYFLLQVNKVKKEEPTETLAQEESSIKQTLIGNRSAQMFSGFNQALEKRWKARTNCAKGFVILYCMQFVPHKEMSLAEQSKLHGRETEAMRTQEEHQVKLDSTAIVKPTILASQNGAKPQFATRYTCYGANVSPPFTWSDLPRATAEVLLLVEQLTDRGVRSKIWTLAGISPSAHGISAGSWGATARARPAGVGSARQRGPNTNTQLRLFRCARSSA
jgi:parvulin-like peptidyl-prolyl isomerase